MSIVASIAQIGHAQVDGRRYVIERHTDHVGVVHVAEYLADAAQTAEQRDAILAARAMQIDAQLKADEVAACLANDRLTTVYITKADLAAFVRELYRNGAGEQIVRIARWIRRRIAAGDFTETQVRNAFGLTVTQWNTLKAKLQAMDDALATVETAVGE
jgi:hypothetical protein